VRRVHGIWSRGEPWIHDGLPAGQDAAAALPPPGTSYVARLDGAKMTDGQGVFETFARELRFPAYFGWNWNAFLDCMRDLSWIPATRHLVVIANSELLLSDEADGREHFLGVMQRVGRTWCSDVGRDPEGSFNTLLL